MHVPHYPLEFNKFYQEFKDFCVDHWLNHTIKSNKAINVLNLNTEQYYHSAIFCLENNIAPTIIDLIGQQRNSVWPTGLLIGLDQQSSWDNFQQYLDTVEGGNKMVAPYSILVPLDGKVSIDFRSYPTNIINDNSFKFEQSQIGNNVLSLNLNQPYLVPSLYPVDIKTFEYASLYVIYRFICPRHKIMDPWLSYTMSMFKKQRLLQ